MHSKNLKRGAQIALAVGAMLSTGACTNKTNAKDPVGSSSQALKCLGGNDCAGMSECAGGPSMNDCQGMNDCKGMGWSYVDTKAECDKAGGTLEES